MVSLYLQLTSAIRSFQWIRHVHTCMHMVHKPMSNASVCTYTIHAMYVYLHFLNFTYMYVHGTYITKYIHVCTWYIHVYTCIFIDVRVSAYVYMYIPCTYKYGPDPYVHECMSQYVQQMYRVHIRTDIVC